MNTARAGSDSSEPILLTEAALENVHEAFPPEDPNAPPAARRREQPGEADHLFASEEANEQLAVVEPPWRTYPAEASPVALKTPPPAILVTASARSVAGSRGKTRVMAATVVALGVLAGVALQQLDRRVAMAPAGNTDAGKPPAAHVPPPAGPETTTASGRATEKPSAPGTTSGPLSGAVLKGSLTPDPPPRPTAESRPRQPVDRIAAAPSNAASPAPRATPVPEAPLPAAPTPGPQLSPAVTAPVATPPVRVVEAEPVLTVDPPAVPAAAPPPAVAAPAPAPAPVPSAVPTLPNDATRIEGVLARYRRAFAALDAGAAKAVWPGVDTRALGRAFDQLREQQLEFQACEIVVNAARATAACGGRARYVPKVGSRSLRDEQRHWTFSLRKVNDDWLIDSVASR